MAQQLKEKFDKVCSQGQQIQKRLKYHQNQLTNLFTKSDVDLHVLESSIDKLDQLYTDIDVCISQSYPELKFSFFPPNMDVSYSVKYAGGTSPTDLILCHNRRCELKEIKSSLKKKIISKELQRRSCVEEKDCVVAVDMKRMVVRGVVMGVGTGQGAVVTILDIDTDDFRMATLDNVYVLDEEAVSLYALCVHCSLDGDLSDLSKYWTSDLSNYFVSALKFGELIIETSHNVDESTVPPRFKVSVEVFVDDTKVLNVNQWLCEQLLPVVKQEAQNCLDLNKVIRGLDSKLLMPYLPTAAPRSTAELSSNISDSCVNSSQIISSPESSARSSTSEESEEFRVDIQIDKYSTPQYIPCESPVPVSGGTGPPQKEIDVYFTNALVMGSPSGDSLETQGRPSKCECGVDCASLLGESCPSDLLTPSPKLPRITTVIPSLARIPNGETFYYTMKNKSKTCLLPTPGSNNSVSGNKSETEIRAMDSFYNHFYERRPLLSTPPPILAHPSANQNGGLPGGSLPLLQRPPWSPKVAHQGILVPIRDVTTRPKWSNGRLSSEPKHKSDNSLSSGGPAPPTRRPPRSHLYTNPMMPPYMEEAYAAGDTQYGEKPLLPLPGAHGPNSRGEGISLKEHHYCQAEHLDKVQSVKLPGSVLLVEPGQERKAMVSSAETPGKFYVIICEDSTAHMDELEQALCEHYSQVANLISLVTIEEARYHLGDFVAAKWKSDGRWYRARVLDWSAGLKNSLLVLYVDHGNVDMVPLDYIQPLDPAFSHYATMAQPCHLAHLAPLGSSSWSQEAVDMFCRFCNRNPHEIFSLKFQPSSSNDSSSSWSVILRNSQDECINDLLVLNGLAAPTKVNGHTPNTPVPSLPSPTGSKDEATRSQFYQKQIARNRTRNRAIVDRILADVRENVKVLVLLRGLPGSGKTTRANELVTMLQGEHEAANPAVFSADHYFLTPGGYKYDVKKIGEAHNWAYKRTETAVLSFQSPIIVDNTNTEEFEILNYYNLAYHNWYKFYVLEPDTDWAFDVKELAWRNCHGVPAERLARMLRRYCWPRKQKWNEAEARPSVESCADLLQESSIT